MAEGKTTIYFVGDSTVCDYAKYDSNGKKIGCTDETYFYDRYGYGTQFNNYFHDINVVNLAMSGRSTKSYKNEQKYSIMTSSIKNGDFLIIGFGHNDEKYDDKARFSSANGALNEEGSFKYNLYNYYIKIAKSVGATPILATPIVRLSSDDDYEGKNGHITEYGDYRKAIIELGLETETEVIDLTSLTKELYKSLGYKKAIYFHAMKAGLNENLCNLDSVDATHINIYGAKMVSYLFANAIKNSNSRLKDYLNDELKEPNKNNDLIKNPSFKFSSYRPIDLELYSKFNKVLSNGFFPTSFGNLGGNPYIEANGFVGYEKDNKFYVGQANSNGTYSYKGKITESDGRSYILKQINSNENFTISADAKVLEAFDISASGFGLVLRDEAYLNINEADYGVGNSFNAGLLRITTSSVAIFSRETSKLILSDNITDKYAKGDILHLEISRVGQVVTCKVEYKGTSYEEKYIDVDLIAIDSKYIYVGMFATRGTVAEFSNVKFELTGKSLGA